MRSDTAVHTLDVLGRRIAISCNRSTIGDAIRANWRQFVVASTGDDRPDVVMRLEQTEEDSRIDEWQFFNNGKLLVIADDRRLVTGYFAVTPWTIDVHTFRSDDQFMYYYLFEPLLLMALARRGLVHWHSASVAVKGQAVLIAGVSGSGKSTTALRLLTNGFAFVADDEVFLETSGAGVHVHGVDGDVYANDDTISLFSQLQHLLQTPLVQRGHRSKRRVPAGVLFPRQMSAPLIRVVLFPTVANGQPTTFHRLSSSAAMMRFLEHQPKELPTLITDPAAVERRLETYRSLAQTARCFEVSLGPDADRLPAAVVELMN